MTKKDVFTSSKAADLPVSLEKCASTSTPVSQVPRILYPRVLYYGDLLNIFACKYIELRTLIIAAVAEMMPEMLCSMW
jgi:hypothetical protein